MFFLATHLIKRLIKFFVLIVARLLLLGTSSSMSIICHSITPKILPLHFLYIFLPILLSIWKVILTSLNHFTHDSPSLSAPSSPSLSSPDTTTSPLVSYPTNTLANLEPSPSFIPRQSSRAKTTPVYLNNYVCLADNVSNHWCNIVQFHHLPPPIQAFINHTTEICEPVNY